MSESKTTPSLRDVLEGHYRAARDRGLPTFGDNIRQSTPLNAAPYVLGSERFRSDFGTSPRRVALLAQLDLLLEEVRGEALVPLFLLTGGSFVDNANPEPGDMDGAIFYTAGMPPAPGALSAIQRRGIEKGLDVRLIPFDTNPLLVAKTLGFFSLLYSQPWGTGPTRAILIVDLAPAPAGDGH